VTKPYIPQGCDQQGRYTPTKPAEACTDLGADADDADDLMGEGAGVVLVPVCFAAACVALFVLLSWAGLL
jgi:hypothetical protein